MACAARVEVTGPARPLPPVDDDVNCNCVSVCTCYAYNDDEREGVGDLDMTEFGGPDRARPAPPAGQCVPPNPHYHPPSDGAPGPFD